MGVGGGLWARSYVFNKFLSDFYGEAGEGNTCTKHITNVRHKINACFYSTPGTRDAGGDEDVCRKTGIKTPY